MELNFVLPYLLEVCFEHNEFYSIHTPFLASSYHFFLVLYVLDERGEDVKDLIITRRYAPDTP